MSIRPVIETSQAQATMEGAGVHLHRAFGFQDPSAQDPFLLLDDFRNDDPDAYLRGFPWHPHRGIETITYVLEGAVEHSDSLGNTGNLKAGDIQWMTAGSGILHQEMPTGNARGQMHGFQLWANLPGSLKMMAPRYQDVSAKEIPEVIDDDGTRVKIVIGEFWGKRGPVDGIAADPLYLDIRVPAGLKKRFKVDTYRNTFAYVFDGQARFTDASPLPVSFWKKKCSARNSIFATCPATARWCALAQAMRSRCRQGLKAFVSSWLRARRSKSLWHGTGPSS